MGKDRKRIGSEGAKIPLLNEDDEAVVHRTANHRELKRVQEKKDFQYGGNHMEKNKNNPFKRSKKTKQSKGYKSIVGLVLMWIPAFVFAQEADTYLMEERDEKPKINRSQNTEGDIADFNIESLMNPDSSQFPEENQKENPEKKPEQEKEPVEKFIDSNLQESMISEHADGAIFLQLGSEMQIYRFKPAERLSQKEINAYIGMIRKGGNYLDLGEMTHKSQISEGTELMSHISYHHLRRVMQILDREGKKITRQQDEFRVPNIFTPISSTQEDHVQKQFSHPLILALLEEEEGRNEELRFKSIESMLGGLLNPDPRVRLIAVNLLRRLIPLASTWDFINERITDQEYGKLPNSSVSLDSHYETVRNTIYEYSDVNQNNALQIVHAELVKLRSFISRFILVEQIQSGEDLILQDIDPVVFQLLSSPIDQESFCSIPLNQMHDYNFTQVLIQGLDHSNKRIQRSVIRNLLRILRTRTIQDEEELKMLIFNELIENPDSRKLVLKGWSEEEIESLSQTEKETLMNVYIQKNGTLKPCPKSIAKDLYDSKQDPIGFQRPRITIPLNWNDTEVVEALMKLEAKESRLEDSSKEISLDTRIEEEAEVLVQEIEKPPIQESYILAP